MGWCRVVGPRGLCRPLDEKQATNKQLGPRALSRLQGRAGQGRGTPPKSTDDTNGRGFGVLLYCLTATKSFAGRRHYSPRIPGGFTLPHRLVETLGRGPRSEPRAPMQMVSGALGSLGFRVGLRTLILGLLHVPSPHSWSPLS